MKALLNIIHRQLQLMQTLAQNIISKKLENPKLKDKLLEFSDWYGLEYCSEEDEDDWNLFAKVSNNFELEAVVFKIYYHNDKPFELLALTGHEDFELSVH